MSRIDVGIVLPRSDLEEWGLRQHAAGRTIAFTNGCFDLLHRGHLDNLAIAAEHADRLLVAVNSDASVKQLKGEGRPVNSLEGRMVVLAALESVDWVVPFSEETPERLICSLLPDIMVKGGDYKPEQIAGGACVEKAGGRVVIMDFVQGFSKSSTIDAIRGMKE